MRRVALLTDRQQIPLLVPASFLSMQESPPTENGLAGFNAARTNSRRSGALRYNAIEYGAMATKQGGTYRPGVPMTLPPKFWNTLPPLTEAISLHLVEFAAVWEKARFVALAATNAWGVPGSAHTHTDVA
ncbi:hypothetical protein [Burkholderia ubonensis]|uniref:hypothetical protein n=1 Tax=Burkholderia ubonensis TaxID=101571 RepID=UPI000F5A45FE|nr:hypothetical protein [Burkholderia ubonensis]